MTFPTYAVSTELDAVNQILSSVGQAPVTTLDLQNPEVAIVTNTLREVNRMVQADGWIFNSEKGITLTPDSTTKKILLQPDVLQVDCNESQRTRYNIVRRNGGIYDRLGHTDVFEESLIVDIIYLFSFSDVPPAIQAYIVARAARMCTVKMVGDSQLNKLLAEQEGITRASAIEYECNQGDYSMFGFKDGENYYQSYQPFHALNR